MDPLQHLLAPRRPLPSPRSKALDGANRNVFALPAIHQFEPVLASSPELYKTAQTRYDPGAAAAVGSPRAVPSLPQRLKSKDTVQSPRALRPQPPVGVSSRTDVDLYRYSQGTEQRMAIKPLLGQRRDLQEETRPASTTRKLKRHAMKGDVASIIDEANDVADDDRNTTLRTGPEDCNCVLLGNESSDTQEASNQVDGRTSSPTLDDYQGALTRDDKELGKQEHEERDLDDAEHLRAATSEDEGLLLLHKLEISSCHEPFLQTEGPKLTWLRDTVTASLASATTPTPGINRQSAVPRTLKPDVVVYKNLGRDLRTLGGSSVLVTVLLSSHGATHITCQIQGSSDDCTVAITGSDLEQSKLLRPDLPVLTPKWARWIITRVRCDFERRFYVDLTDAEGSEKRVCFSKIIHSNGKEITVEMVALVAASSLLVSARETTCNANAADLLLRTDDLRRLAQTFGKWDDKGEAGEDVSTLFDDNEFLNNIAIKSNVIRLAMSCAGSSDELEDSLLSGACPTSFTNVTIDAQATVNAPINMEILDSPSYVQEAFQENNFVGTVALLTQAYVENGILSTLRHFQQQEVVQLNVAAFMQQAASLDSEAAINERVEQILEAARMAKLREIAIISIIDDMILGFIVYECRAELHAAKYSGGYDDHYASKVQATYRMSTQKRSYDHKRHVRIRAAQMVQALQRGIIARRRYSEMKVEREKYLFYGFRSSLYHATANMKDPRLRARDLSKETERRRHAFLMQVIQGYVAENFTDDEFRVSAQLVRDIYNEYGVVVGCSTSFGDGVVAYLDHAPDQALYARVGDSTQDSNLAPRLFSSCQVSAALLLGLRDQYDDTFGLSSSARRRLSNESMQQPRRRTLEGDNSAPPRWMLKSCLSFQQSNLDRLAGLRLTRKAAGTKSAHLVARDYLSVLASSFDSFDKCRATWEADIHTRQDQQRTLNTLSVDELAQHCLDLLISCVKDWGIDPEPLFEALNLCGRHCHGKAAIQIVEVKFNAYAARMNGVHGKQSVLTLRKEISQELEDFEKLLALRCLNMAVDDTVTVPTSELLYIMLNGNLDEEYIRHGLSTVLPIASITEKHDLARKMLYAFANASYGDAFNLICWSCLDVAENVTVEAARFLDKITRLTTDDADTAVRLSSSESLSTQTAKTSNPRSSESLASRALYLLTGSQAVRFMQFLTKVAHFNKSIQKRVLAHLAPYAEKYEMHRLASAVCSLEDFSIVSQMFDECFSVDVLRSCAAVWTQYTTLFGENKSLTAMNDIKAQAEIPDT